MSKEDISMIQQNELTPPQVNTIVLFVLKLIYTKDLLLKYIGTSDFKNVGNNYNIALKLVDLIIYFLNLLNKLNADLLTNEGKIKVSLNTSNDYKLTSIKNYLKVSSLGSILSNIFEFVPIFPKDTVETKFSFQENSNKKSITYENPDVYIIGDDSGIVSDFLTGLLINNETKEANLVPGVISKRWLSEPLFLNIMKKYLDNDTINDLLDLNEFLDLFNIEVGVKNTVMLYSILKEYESEALVNPTLMGLVDKLFDCSLMTSLSVSLNDKIKIMGVIESIQGIVEFSKVNLAIVNTNSMEEDRIIAKSDKFSNHLILDNFKYLLQIAKTVQYSHGYNAIFKIKDYDKVLDQMNEIEIINYDHRTKAFNECFYQILKDFLIGNEI
ncbi:MAG: hypothetical protein [Bacteriophage sp.]|nr:MAG: hypothetical protein [Bacteriophage sp.]